MKNHRRQIVLEEILKKNTGDMALGILQEFVDELLENPEEISQKEFEEEFPALITG